jgi:hypothetical protein
MQKNTVEKVILQKVTMEKVIQGTLTAKDAKQHIPHTFEMPPQATKLFIRLEYTPQRATGQAYDNMLSLTLFDPQGCRGARHNNADQSLTITEFTATPGYTPGVLQNGTWTIFIDTHRILPPEVIEYKLEIDISDEPIVETVPQYKRQNVKARGVGWYRGDLHGHTFHSDASWDVPDFVQYARNHNLDFVTLTDHNTVSGLAQLDSLAGDDLLTIGGSELTTYYGHALALGVRTWQEWRVGIEDVTMPDIAKQIKAKGGVFAIAHPKSIGDPDCTGCDWHYQEMMPGNARHLEIWNGSWAGDSGNEKGLELWYQWLNQGYRMVATAGTDIHGRVEPQLGFNHVYAKDLSEYDLLTAISQGHLYLSSGPLLDFTARNARLEHVMMGDVIPRGDVTLSLHWSGCEPGDVIGLIVHGGLIEEYSPAEQGMLEKVLPDHARWCVVEVRDKDGNMRAVTNPIFVGEEKDYLHEL